MKTGRHLTTIGVLLVASLLVLMGCSGASTRKGQIVIAKTVAQQHQKNALATFWMGGKAFLDARAHRLYQEASALVRKEAFDEAVLKLEEIEPGQRTTTEILDALGMLYLRKGRIDEARSAAEAALAMNPTDPCLHLHLGFVDLEEGDSDAYVAVVNALLDELPDDHALHAELLCRKGFKLRKENEEEGTALMRKSCDLGDKNCCELLEE